MLERLVGLAIRQRLLVLIALGIVLAGAAYWIPRLNLDAFPDVTNVQVTVNTQARGLAAEEVEQLITYPVESVMYQLANVEQVRSISLTGLSVVTVVFNPGTDIYFARQQVFQQLNAARDLIPAGVGEPEMGANTSALSIIYQYIVRADDPQQYNAMDLRSLNDWLVKRLLLPVPGVTNIVSFGGQQRQYQVRLDAHKLLAQKLTVDDVVNALAASNQNAGGWYLDRAQEQLVVRGVGLIASGQAGLQAIGNTQLKTLDGAVVRVADVGDVGLGGAVRQGAATMIRHGDHGQDQDLGEVVVGQVLKRIGANTNATIEDVDARLPQIQKALPDGVHIEPFYDQGELIREAVATVRAALLEAFVLIVIVLALFLVNLRATLLVLLSIPLSIGMALAVMGWAGVSANLMSLGGLAIAIGMMVDGSVVMMENIFKHLGAEEGGAIGDRIADAAREMARPVFFAVLIIIVVFVPLFTLQGVEGKLFTPMSVSIVLAMLASLLVALVAIPALAVFLFTKPVRRRRSWLLAPLERGYRRLLPVALRARVWVALGAVALFAGAIALFANLGTEFVPALYEGTAMVRMTLAPSVSLDTAKTLSREVERRLFDVPEVTYVLGFTGRGEVGGEPEAVANTEFFVGLKPAAQWTTAHSLAGLQQALAARLSHITGAAFAYTQPIASRVDELLSGVKAQLAVKLFGPDLDVLQTKGRALEQLVRATPGTRDVALEQISGEAQLVVRPDRAKLARYGVPVAQVMALVSDAIGGAAAGQIIDGNQRYEINVRLARRFRDNITAIRGLTLQAPNGALLRLGDIARVAIESGPPQIRREDVQRRVVVQANVGGRDLGSLVRDLQQRVDRQLQLPPGYSVVYGGDFKNAQRAQARLRIVVPIALGLILLLLYLAFGSFKQALLIILDVPLAMVGGVAALFISGLYLSVPGSIGFIALAGVAVLNGVVLVAAINQRRAQGLAMDDAIFEGAVSRLRPVLMTASIASLGLIPMLLATGIGSNVQRPLATVVVGGLVSATALTLFVLPALYPWFAPRKPDA